MILTQYLGNNTSAALRVVQSLYGKAGTTRIIDDGYENLVIIADETHTVRFPRAKEVWDNSHTERFVLQKLAAFNDMPVPRLIKISNDPAYLVLSCLKGNQLTTEQIRSLPNTALQDIGREIAKFAYLLHSRLPVDEIRREWTPPTWSYNDYLRRVLVDRQDPNPTINALAKKYYDVWQHKATTHEVVVHDDLHTGNLLFDNQFHLSGVLDFGAICIGTPEQELRQVYRLGNDALEAAAATYEGLSGRPFNRETAKVWTITQELAAYCRAESGLAHDRAAENLRFWFPKIDF